MYGLFKIMPAPEVPQFMYHESIQATDWSDPDRILALFRKIPHNPDLVEHTDFLLKQIPPGIYELPLFSPKKRQEKTERLAGFAAGMLEALVECEFASVRHLVTPENKIRPDYPWRYFKNTRIISFLESVPEEIRSRAILAFNLPKAETEKNQPVIVIWENKPVINFPSFQPAAA